MNKNINSQPDFVGNVVTNVLTTLKPRARAKLVVTYPDYTQPIGLDNLFRTSLELSAGSLVPVKRVAHLSNILGGDQDTMCVVYEVGSEKMAKQICTRQYQSATKMALKDHAVSNIGHCDETFIQQDIAAFLQFGKLPS